MEEDKKIPTMLDEIKEHEEAIKKLRKKIVDNLSSDKYNYKELCFLARKYAAEYNGISTFEKWLESYTNTHPLWRVNLQKSEE